MTGLTQLSALAKSSNNSGSADGDVQWMDLEIESREQLAQVLTKANSENIFVFRGGSSRRKEKFQSFIKHREGDRPAQAVFLSFNKLNKVVEHVRPDQVITVETGISVNELNTMLAEHGQWLPLEFASDEVSLADLLDSGDGGTLEIFSRGMKQLVLGMELALAQGELIKTGGKIVKNVTGYDLSKLFVGSHSWLAVPYLVHLRLFGRPHQENCFIVKGKPKDLCLLASTLRTSGLSLFSLEVCSTGLLQECLRRILVSGSTDGAVTDWSRLETILADDSQTGSILIVSTRGHETVTTESGKVVKQLVESTSGGLTVETIESETGNRLQRLCSQLFELSSLPYVEVSLSPSALSYFFETFWQQLGRPDWYARPIQGRLRLSPLHMQTAAALVDQLRQFANLINHDGLSPLTVAYSTKESERTIEHLSSPHGYITYNQVIQGLKSRYDRNGILNPLVRFAN